MSSNRKIVRARITAMPQSMFDKLPEVMVVYEGSESEELLFSYFPDELSFSESEFIGLTAEQARALKHKKDLAYLRS